MNKWGTEVTHLQVKTIGARDRLLHRCLCVFGLVLSLALNEFAQAQTTYFIDAVNGSDVNQGTSESVAWKTLQRANNNSFKPGDRILLRRGQTWREQLVITVSGASDKSIVFGAYGTGSNPVLDGSALFTKWMTRGGGVYSIAMASQVRAVYYKDGTKLINDPGKAGSVGPNRWDLTSNILYVNLGGVAADSLNVVTDASAADGIVVGNTTPANAQSYITIENISVTRFKRWLVQGINTNHLTVQNCVLTSAGPGDSQNDPVGVALNHGTQNALIQSCFIGHIEKDSLTGAGIYIGSAYRNSALWQPRFNVIQKNIITDVATGITMKYGGYDNRVEGNHIFNVRKYGIVSVGSEQFGNVVCRNIVHDVGSRGDVGIMAFNHTAVYYNVVYNTYNGIFLNSIASDFENYMNSGDSCLIYNNVVWNAMQGITLWNVGVSRCIGNSIQNNIVANSNLAISLNEKDDVLQNTFNFNCYYSRSGPQQFFAGTQTTLGEWQVASGQEKQSIELNPMFLNDQGFDFHLQSNSPCKGRGIDVGLERDLDSTVVRRGANPSMGSYESLAPTLDLAPSSIRFGNLVIGQTGSQVVVIMNEGSVPVTISKVATNGPGFSVLPETLTLPAGGVGGVAVAFSPLHRGSYSAALTIISNSPIVPIAIPLNGTGSVVTTTVDPQNSTDFLLQQNYPNPFNPSTSIRYDIPASAFVTIEVFDIAGRLVKSLVNDQQAAGSHEVILDAVALASGTYVYRMQVGDYRTARKCVVLK